MKIAVIGVTGMTGRQLVDDLLAMGHQVTGIARNPQTLTPRPGLTLVPASVLKQSEITRATAGHDVVVNAFSAGHGVELRVYKDTIEGTRRVIRAAKDNRTPYLIHIGGAASLYVGPGVQMMDDPRFPIWYFRCMPPEHIKWLGGIIGWPFTQALVAERRHELAHPGAEAFQGPTWLAFEKMLASLQDFPLLEGCRVAFDLFEHNRSFNWTFLSPPWLYRPGPATGKYRTVVDELPMEGEAPAGITLPDLTRAVAEECENRRFLHVHWSVARIM